MHPVSSHKEHPSAPGITTNGKATTNPLQLKTVEEEDDDDAVQMKQNPLQLQTEPEDEELIQKKENPLQLKKSAQNPLQLRQPAGNPLQLQGKETPAAQPAKNNTGLPDNLKAGIESLSGYSMDDVQVHYNSDKPAQLQALAYAQGTDIHIAPGQERHLPHEAWHVVQQKQGRVQPTMQMKGGVAVNDDEGLENEADKMGSNAMNVTQMNGSASNTGLVTQRITSYPVQLKGVKSELAESEATFESFKDETDEIIELKNEVADNIYEAYKPSGDLDQPYHDKSNRDKSKGKLKNKTAKLKAQRLNNWTNTAVVSAQRIYLELIAAMEKVDELGLGGDSLTFGEDTDKEPDVFIKGNIALEVKHITTSSQGGVDNHVKKASEQLDKRKFNTAEGVPVTQWIAHIKIQNGDNPWPYTPTGFIKAIKKKTGNPAKTQAEAIKRINKYKNAGVSIEFRIQSENPSIGTFFVTV